jgi:hypothetical protein
MPPVSAPRNSCTFVEAPTAARLPSRGGSGMFCGPIVGDMSVAHRHKPIRILGLSQDEDLEAPI